MANALTIQDISIVVNSIVSQATANTAFANVDLTSVLGVYNVSDLVGHDPLIDSISQVLTNTIFSSRKYNRKFASINVGEAAFGNHERKISYISNDADVDEFLPLTDGDSVDQWTIKKPKSIQTNNYGIEDFRLKATIHTEQMDTAFKNQQDAMSYISNMLVELNNDREQMLENMSRALVSGYLAGVVAGGNPEQTIHLLTEYNTLTGQTFSVTDIYSPDTFRPFMQWVYSRIAEISQIMTERSYLFHTNITGKKIRRHTPIAKQRVYISSAYKYQTEAMVLADTYHPSYLNGAVTEFVNFWQSIGLTGALSDRMSINVVTNYLAADGTVTNATQSVSNIFGIIFDIETLGYKTVKRTFRRTHENAAGLYSNLFWRELAKYYIDYTENGVVFLLD